MHKCKLALSRNTIWAVTQALMISSHYMCQAAPHDYADSECVGCPSHSLFDEFEIVCPEQPFVAVKENKESKYTMPCSWSSFGVM